MFNDKRTNEVGNKLRILLVGLVVKMKDYIEVRDEIKRREESRAAIQKMLDHAKTLNW